MKVTEKKPIKFIEKIYNIESNIVPIKRDNIIFPVSFSSVFPLRVLSFLFFLHEGITVILGRIQVLLHHTRACPAQEVQVRAGFIVCPGTSGSAERLLADHGPCGKFPAACRRATNASSMAARSLAKIEPVKA